MSTERNEAIRKEILMQLYAERPLAFGAPRIARDAAKGGYDYTRAEIDRELDFLSGERLLDVVNQPGITLPVFKISSLGIRTYENTYRA
jgi:hypothetical protein